jgi:FKBP-type peptidyl-prolyl cis-trans isomerase FkpA
MKKTLFGALVITIVLASCSGGFKKGDGGTEYRIVGSGKGDKLKAGSFIEFNYKQMYKDSVLLTSADYANQVTLFDSTNIPKEIYSIFAQCRLGDSVIIKIPVDSAFRGQLPPPPFKKGQFILTGYKIVNVFSERSQADSAMKAQNAIAEAKMKKKEELQIATDDKTITEYLAKNNIKAVKAPLGTYVAISQPGTGAVVDTSVAVKVNYTGKTLAGKVFDSNTDPAFQHVEPYTVSMWQPGVIRGWLDGLTLFSKGAKGQLFIPSSLAYGPKGSGKDIGPNAILVFDIEVLDITPKAIAIAQQEALQKKQEAEYMALQKKYDDSVRLAAKKDSLAKKK